MISLHLQGMWRTSKHSDSIGICMSHLILQTLRGWRGTRLWSRKLLPFWKRFWVSRKRFFFLLFPTFAGSYCRQGLQDKITIKLFSTDGEDEKILLLLYAQGPDWLHKINHLLTFAYLLNRKSHPHAHTRLSEYFMSTRTTSSYLHHLFLI